MKKILFATLIIVLSSNFSFSQILLQESFETDGEGARYTSNSFYTAPSDFFTRMDNNPATYALGNGLGSHPTNPNGSFYWGAEDCDAAAGGEGILTLNPITVTGFSLDVSVLLANGRPNDFRLENGDYFILEYNMDGGGWNVFGALRGNTGTGSGNLQDDAGFDGLPDPTGIEINSSDFIDVNYSIPVTGNSLQVRCRVLANTGSESIIFDNIRINGTAACTDPTVPTVTYSPATVCAGGSASLNITGTLNDATAWQVYTGSCGGTNIGSTTTGTFAIPGTINTPTTYYVRGEGGCVTPSSCGAVTITPQALDDASFSYGAASYCVNDADPTPTITGLGGGTFSSTAGLALNSLTGLIDVSASTPGAYTVTYTTAGICPNSSNVSVTINALDDASFSYGAGSYCVNASDPTPTITGLGGGTFSSTAGLSINGGTGSIDVSASTPGTYTVTYTTAGTCPNSSNVTVTINALDDASFSSGAGSYCVNASDPTPTITGLGGGTFSSTAGLALNSLTGLIDVSASTPGTYTVTYTTAGTCPNNSNVTVTINALDDASFSYGAGTYCVNASDPTPTITGLGGGSFASAAGLSINGGTGTIDVSASTPGTYTVTYTTAGACPNSSNISVTINALDDPSFSYGAGSYCVNDSDPTPTITGLSGGTFSSTAGLSINGGIGSIDVSASTPGTYTVTYTTAGTCPNSSNVSVTINALDDASFSYGAGSYCVNDSDPTPTITGLVGGTFSSTAGLSISGGTGAIDVSASTPGTYTVTYTTAGTCPNSSNVTVTISALDDPSFSYGAGSYCVNDSDPTPTITGLSGGTFSSTAGLSINGGIGSIDVSASTPGTYTVTYTTAGTCPNSSNVSVTINALDDASFSYGAGSYCVNDSDPTPTITGLGGGTFSSSAGLSINGGTGAIDVSASTPGTFTVTYTTAGTCPSNSNVSVTINALDDASFSYSQSSYCPSGADPTPTISGLTGGTFSSSPAGLSLNTGDGSVDLSASSTNNYTVTYTTVGTCPNSSNVNLEISSSVNNTVNLDLCSGSNHTYADGTTSTNITVNESHISTLTGAAASGCDSVVTENINVLPIMTNTVNLDVCSGSSHTYADGTTSTGITVNESHVSTLTGAAANGCDSVVTENVNVLPIPTETIDSNICIGTDYTYADGTTSTDIQVNESHVSTLAGAAVNGCDSVVTEILTIITVDTSVTVNGTTITANSTAATNHQWLNCDNGNSAMSGETNTDFTATTNGNYAIEVTENGCVDTSSCVSIINVGLDENGFAQTILIYPNPTNHLINVQMIGSSQEYGYVLMAADGRIIAEQNGMNASEFSIDIENESNGVYYLRIKNAKNTIIRKVVKN